MEFNITKRLQWYLIHKHIIPYTYELQPKELMMDVRSFNMDYTIVNDVYNTHYTSSILYNDLQSYCHNNSYQISTKCQELLSPYMSILPSMNYLRVSRLIWGILKPCHRTDFINKYILEDEIEMSI